jgi:phosphomethylpyrimidine synthase
MRISQDVRRLAEAQGVTAEEALEEGLRTKAVEFVAAGASLYHEPRRTPGSEGG